ncbi:MAG: DUF4166 domain-containing protein [Variovorax paradoxus]|uniref:DUF4166 domain-containing protein n=1 Tax=Variovorax paradoxus TaxID=34073 RepID=A0A2W5S2I3_VARPD|nr:MAG: DUF4166 domain-containing protein [Variovorax paradoxus]
MTHTPVFQTVLGDADWQRLGAVVRRHYGLRPRSEDHMTVRGRMDEVWHAPWAALLMPAGRLFGALVPHTGRDVPIEVNYRCRPQDAGLYWDRCFHFEGQPVFHFRSHMTVADAARHEVVEWVRFGLGLRLRVTAEEGALVFRDVGYVWRIGRLQLPLPLHLLLGRAHVEERPVPGDAGAFTMKMAIGHPLWGEVFRYSGRFRLD